MKTGAIKTIGEAMDCLKSVQKYIPKEKDRFLVIDKDFVKKLKKAHYEININHAK